MVVIFDAAVAASCEILLQNWWKLDIAKLELPYQFFQVIKTSVRHWTLNVQRRSFDPFVDNVPQV
jgi:hypothetical protein